MSDVHSWLGPDGRLELAQLVELEQAHDPAAVARVDATRAAHGARRASSACSASGPRRASSASQRARTSSGAAGRRVELRERRAQVQPGAADDDRAGALGEQAVDLRVGQLGVLADREARVDRQDRDQPVLQARALGAPTARR